MTFWDNLGTENEPSYSCDERDFWQSSAVTTEEGAVVRSGNTEAMSLSNHVTGADHLLLSSQTAGSER